MQKLIAILIISGILAPALAFADTQNVNEPTLGQLLSRLAAVESMEKGSAIGCHVAATKTAVHVGEVFTIGWGSYGADPSYSHDPQNAYAINGQQSMSIAAPGTRTYKFTFYGPNGTQAECDQTITVSA